MSMAPGPGCGRSQLLLRLPLTMKMKLLAVSALLSVSTSAAQKVDVASTIDDQKVIPLHLLRSHNVRSITNADSQLEVGNWSQIGQDIDGEAIGDQSGWSVSLSAEGNIVAIGAHDNDDNGSRSGHVRVFKLLDDTTKWVQQGIDIIGEAYGDWSGYSVSLSADGNVVAVGAPLNRGGGPGSGHTRVLAYDSDGDVYVQRGIDLNGKSFGEKSGWSVGLSADGEVVAIGAPYSRANGLESGQTRVFEYDGVANYVQRGGDINGEAAGDRSGWSVTLSSDGSVVAIGAIYNDEKGSNSGHVRVFWYDGNDYVPRGKDINGGAAGDSSGRRVSLSSDGSIVAIGAHGDDENGPDAGHVRVFEFDGTDYVQRGDDINGEAAGDRLGWSVSLSSDGDVVAVGAMWNDGNGPDAGHARVYKFDGSNYVQRGDDIDGEAAGDSSGRLVSLSSDGNTIAVGAYRNDGNGSSSGHVRTYKFTVPTPMSSSDSTTKSAQAVWLIAFESMDMDFTSNSTNEEVRLTYEVGTGRVPVTKLYSGGCESNQATKAEFNVSSAGAITKTLQLTDNNVLGMDTYMLSYNFSKSLIAASDFWNDVTKSIELCQVIQLVHERAEAEDLVIQEDKRNITVNFELFANFSIDTGLDKATVNTANGKSNLEGYISAYHCDGNDDMKELPANSKLKPNDELAVCLLSSSADVEIDEITSMVIKGDNADGVPSELAVIYADVASIPAITETRFVNSTAFIVQTRVPINLFDFKAPGASIDVEGGVKLNFKVAAAPENDRRLQSYPGDEEASFGVSIGLEADGLYEDEGITLATSAAAGVRGSVVILGAVFAVYTAWY